MKMNQIPSSIPALTEVPRSAYDLRKQELFLYDPVPTYGPVDAARYWPTWVGHWKVFPMQQTESRTPYSKAYHRRYGPTIVTLSRVVVFARPHRKPVIIEIERFTRNAVLDAALFAGIVKPNQGCDGKKLLNIRRHAAYALERRADQDGAQIYKRSLGGEFIDWVAVKGTAVERHADKYRACHLVTVPPADRPVVTLEFARRLELCQPGIENFCGITGVRIDRAYSWRELLDVIDTLGERLKGSVIRDYWDALRVVEVAVLGMEADSLLQQRFSQYRDTLAA